MEEIPFTGTMAGLDHGTEIYEVLPKTTTIALL